MRKFRLTNAAVEVSKTENAYTAALGIRVKATGAYEVSAVGTVGRVVVASITVTGISTVAIVATIATTSVVRRSIARRRRSRLAAARRRRRVAAAMVGRRWRRVRRRWMRWRRGRVVIAAWRGARVGGGHGKSASDEEGGDCEELHYGEVMDRGFWFGALVMLLKKRELMEKDEMLKGRIRCPFL